eukprot:CAMPEP_0114571450 /NCGR_PEP_ID=MMETSP0114-20121206/17752_1 /TAXON_ID=31324 /ORGANISM="Goniomonas sp, Strain m" /LENGTH=131 /DNA_ID=CAMNT_0001758569 /DNA_START=292 /DNA_END=687 /DNA_ORIENTATION=-
MSGGATTSVVLVPVPGGKCLAVHSGSFRIKAGLEALAVTPATKLPDRSGGTGCQASGGGTAIGSWGRGRAWGASANVLKGLAGTTETNTLNYTSGDKFAQHFPCIATVPDLLENLPFLVCALGAQLDYRLF